MKFNPVTEDIQVLLESDYDDGSHKQSELYEHRTALLSMVCNLYNEAKPGNNVVWKTKHHHPMDDNEMYDGYFLVGFTTPEGLYSYHCEMKFWNMFNNVREIAFSPVFDGHQPEDYPRLFSLLKEGIKCTVTP